MNVVDKWERKVIRYIKKLDDPKPETRDLFYQKAMAYCDCIHNFTYDKDQFDCFDRLSNQVER
jgi:hypothetical protein